MRAHFEYYIDENYKDNENTILYGKSIMIASMEGHSDSWTKKEQKILFLKDTMTYKELAESFQVKEPTIFGIHKNAVKKLNNIVETLLNKRDFFNKFS